jgi:hypothetical protein
MLSSFRLSKGIVKGTLILVYLPALSVCDIPYGFLPISLLFQYPDREELSGLK